MSTNGSPFRLLLQICRTQQAYHARQAFIHRPGRLTQKDTVIAPLHEILHGLAIWPLSKVNAERRCKLNLLITLLITAYRTPCRANVLAGRVVELYFRFPQGR